jgi:hypothetical protein
MREPKRVAHIPGFSDEQKTADELGLVTQTLRVWRRQGKGPPYAKFGRNVFYPDAERAEWLKSRIIKPVREPIRDNAA